VVKQLQRLAALSADERWLLARAAALVASIRIALWLLPLHWICRWAHRSGAVSRPLEAMPASRLAWVVQVAARRIPGASCLTQAMALQWLLVRAGRAASLQLGVAKDAAHGFESHAWVECEGQVFLDDSDVAVRFVPIAAFPAN